MIHFFSDDISFSLANEKQVSSWVVDVFSAEEIHKEVYINVVFCSDEKLLSINKQFLNHDYYTDIITFPVEENENSLEAELYISLDRVKENSKEDFQKELHRVIIHGILHLCGYHDKSESDIKKMREKEDQYLKLLQL